MSLSRVLGVAHDEKRDEMPIKKKEKSILGHQWTCTQSMPDFWKSPEFGIWLMCGDLAVVDCRHQKPLLMEVIFF